MADVADERERGRESPCHLGLRPERWVVWRAWRRDPITRACRDILDSLIRSADSLESGVDVARQAVPALKRAQYVAIPLEDRIDCAWERRHPRRVGATVMPRASWYPGLGGVFWFRSYK